MREWKGVDHVSYIHYFAPSDDLFPVNYPIVFGREHPSLYVRDYIRCKGDFRVCKRLVDKSQREEACRQKHTLEYLKTIFENMRESNRLQDSPLELSLVLRRFSIPIRSKTRRKQFFEGIYI